MGPIDQNSSDVISMYVDGIVGKFRSPRDGFIIVPSESDPCVVNNCSSHCKRNHRLVRKYLALPAPWSLVFRRKHSIQKGSLRLLDARSLMQAAQFPWDFRILHIQVNCPSSLIEKLNE